MAIKNSTKLHP